ncbi:Pimeloyl-ACP methyl ester carboxylesterase [Lentzea xinjiangensis]|uniref:Pimeloyl-ACP methyl ester carboxylesterase n=1 Tax=Lentzea xinjiangensis TaxID=402600 RepID=A0A1H9LN30_9PSEU|nr:alpha/beta hydrolase [Lentzea xinjiangensis]SER12902.1 Pimeloyl-ACP methyl ester carboxylesterase [Lentzea xinjiangensis]
MPSADRVVHEVVHEQVPLRVHGINVKLAWVRRAGADDPVVFLHGFGTSKEDFLDVAQRHDFTGRPFLAYDAPGAGATECADLGEVTLPFLVATARAALDRAGIGRCHVVGHSTGALTALLLAHEEPGRVLSFVNIKGVLAPEDCVLSREALTHRDPGEFFFRLAHRSRDTSCYGGGLFAANLPAKLRRGAVPTLFRSMVELADHGELVPKFLSLPCPRLYLYGKQCAGLSYLPVLDANGVELAEIPHSGHLPMYSNPVAMWRQIAEFHARQLMPVARRW